MSDDDYYWNEEDFTDNNHSIVENIPIESSYVDKLGKTDDDYDNVSNIDPNENDQEELLLSSQALIEESNLLDEIIDEGSDIQETTITNDETITNKIVKMESSHQLLNQWPEPIVEDFNYDWPDFTHKNNIEQWIQKNKKILIRTITWNLNAKKPPDVNDVRKILMPSDKFHLYFIGSEECERSIAQSAINTSKKNWESYLINALGSSYKPLRAHTLQATHIMLFAHKSIAQYCSNVTSAAVACGIGNALGNKGGVAIQLNIGNTKILVINAHLAAHQNAVKQRNNDFYTIIRYLPEKLNKNISDSVTTLADRVIFMGDLNYRIRGNRKAITKLISLNMHEVMLHNDQLKWSISKGLAFTDFTEAPLNFKPTYKLDVDSDEYDTGTKKRIPAWTDRILYIPNGIECIAYNSDHSLRTSDHRPVYGSFKISIDIDMRTNNIENNEMNTENTQSLANISDNDKVSAEFSSESSV